MHIKDWFRPVSLLLLIWLLIAMVNFAPHYVISHFTRIVT